MNPISHTLAALLLGSILAAPLQATVIMQDDFADASKAKTGALDGDWWHFGVTSTLPTDAITGPDEGSPDHAFRFAQQTGARGVAAYLGSQSIANQGDSLELIFDVRYEAVANNATAFRFGFYNSSASDGNIPADVNNSDANLPWDNGATGYFVAWSTGTSKQVITRKETNGTGTALILSGVETPDVGSANTTGAFSGLGTGSQNIGLRMTRVLTGVQLDVLLNGLSVHTTTDTTGIFESFNTIGFVNNDGSNRAINLDNVHVTAIPEPSSLLLIGLALGALAFVRRR